MYQTFTCHAVKNYIWEKKKKKKKKKKPLAMCVFISVKNMQECHMKFYCMHNFHRHMVDFLNEILNNYLGAVSTRTRVRRVLTLYA